MQCAAGRRGTRAARLRKFLFPAITGFVTGLAGAGFNFEPFLLKNQMESEPSRKMKMFNKFSSFHRLLALAVLGLAPVSAGAAVTNLTYTAEATIRETYDNNVYIQDTTPLPANVAAANAAGLHPVSALKASLLTTITPRLGLDYKPCPAFNLSVVYAPEINLYTSVEDEDYIAHRTTFNFGGKIKDATWELLNAPTFIEGGTQGPTFARPEDVPAIGGIPLRDRREAFILRDSFRLTLPLGHWFIRPVASYYYHDFLTDQRLNTAPRYYYENYLSRQDVNGGLDIGYEIIPSTFLVAGYRYGQQDQFTGPNGNNTAFTDSPYDSSYHRLLFGAEGSPVKWLKMNFLLGPEFRRFDPGTPAGFIRYRTLLYVDASLTVLPTKADTVTLRATRFEQPAFSSQSVYQDIKYDLAWRHKFTDHFTAGAGFTLYEGDWQQPVNRDDWIYTPSVTASYAFDKHWSAEFNYSLDLVDSRVSTSAAGAAYADGREFSRDLISLAVRCAF